jgi:hypothetical protein
MNIFSKIDHYRIETDRLIQNAVICEKSAETTLAWRSLQMAKSWLGKLKVELGSGTPYVVVSDVKNIPKTVEVYQGDLQLSDDNLFNINLMREEIQKLHTDISNSEINTHTMTSYALQHLSEARFWYGFELQNLRKI